MEAKKDQIALWRKSDRNGREYYYVIVEIEGKKYSFSAFQNKYKSNDPADKKPDFKGDLNQPKAPEGWGEKKVAPVGDIVNTTFTMKPSMSTVIHPPLLTEDEMPF